jgi:ERCC4-related helicase
MEGNHHMEDNNAKLSDKEAQPSNKEAQLSNEEAQPSDEKAQLSNEEAQPSDEEDLHHRQEEVKHGKLGEVASQMDEIIHQSLYSKADSRALVFRMFGISRLCHWHYSNLSHWLHRSETSARMVNYEINN